MACTAVRNDGSECGHKAKTGEVLCGVHLNSALKSGPHGFALNQMKIRQKKDLADLTGQMQHQLEMLVKDASYDEEKEKVMLNYQLQVMQMKGLHAEKHLALLAKHRREIAETGVDPDVEAKAKKAAQRVEYERRRDQRRRTMMVLSAISEIRRIRDDATRYLNDEGEDHFVMENNASALRRIFNAIRRQFPEDIFREADAQFGGGTETFIEEVAVELEERAVLFHMNIVAGRGGAGARRGDLADFVNDGQNVHTTAAVRQTMDIIERVRRIPVPEGYRWNRDVVSPTIGEIIAQCKLSSSAAAQMFNKYVSAETIYDLEEGIYGKVLDSVWQYVKTSSDRADLCKILRQEMEDNVGMCAQGNLTRICNILAGYLDGVGSQESVAERLGRLFPPLMEIEDDGERRRRAEEILTENAVPREEWGAWMDAVM
jgi:hypothetical protein